MCQSVPQQRLSKARQQETIEEYAKAYSTYQWIMDNFPETPEAAIAQKRRKEIYRDQFDAFKELQANIARTLTAQERSAIIDNYLASKPIDPFLTEASRMNDHTEKESNAELTTYIQISEAFEGIEQTIVIIIHNSTNRYVHAFTGSLLCNQGRLPPESVSWARGSGPALAPENSTRLTRRFLGREITACKIEFTQIAYSDSP